MSGPFKMKGFPSIEGTSPVKKKKEKTASELVAERTKLRERATELEKRKEEGKVTFLGKRKRRRTEKKIKKVQAEINVNPEALQWKKDAEAKAEEKVKETGTPNGMGREIKDIKRMRKTMPN